MKIPNAFKSEDTYIARTKLNSTVVAALLECFCNDMTSSATADKLSISRITTDSIYQKIRIRILDLSFAEFSRFAEAIPVNRKLYELASIEPSTHRLEIHRSRFRIFSRITTTRTASAYTGVLPEKIQAESVYSLPLTDAYRFLVKINRRHQTLFGKGAAHAIDQQMVELVRRKNEEMIQRDWLRKFDREFEMPPKSAAEEVIHRLKTTRLVLRCINRSLYPPGSRKRKDIMTFLYFTKARFMAMRGVSQKHFLLHLKESEWRFNHRSDDIAELLQKELLTRPL